MNIRPRWEWAVVGVLLVPALLAAKPEVIEITADLVEELPGGREADGIVGDFVLRNERIEAVISHDAPHRRANMSTFFGPGGETPGCLYDLTFRGTDNDQLTIFSPANQRGRVSWVREVPGTGEDEAAVECVRSAALGEGLALRHEYRLQAGAVGLWITSEFTNEASASRDVDLRDVWTRFLRHGKYQDYAWADAVDPADRCGYAYRRFEPEPGSKIVLAPGETFTMRRFFAVGRSPAEAIGRVAEEFGEATRLRLEVVDEAGQGVGDSRAVLQPAARVQIPAYPDPGGTLRIPFLRGELQATVDAPGRAARELETGSEAKRVVLGDAAAIRFHVTDGEGRDLPCKVQFRGIDGTENPDLGPSIRAHGCADQWHSETGRFEVKLPEGTYRVIVTRGPEYGHVDRRIVATPDEPVSLRAVLERRVDTTGWVSADFHNHSTPSGDNVCGIDDRVINLAAEHLEFVPTTEHNRLYDWQPHIESLGLSAHMTTVPGIELTGRGAHINAFPLKPVPRTQDGGAPVCERDPRGKLLHQHEVGGWGPDEAHWTQINHPDLSENFIDRDRDGEADGGFFLLDQFVGGVETQNYRASRILDGVPYYLSGPLARGGRVRQVREFVWLQLLNQGINLRAVAVADAHTVYGNGVGSWRTYLPSTTDVGGEIRLPEMLAHARAGHMILSSGPFLEVDFGPGILPGDTVTRLEGSVEASIRVQCADWYDVDRVQVLVNGRQPSGLNFTRESHPHLFADGVVRFEHDVSISLPGDAHLIVVAMGENSTLAKGFGTSPQSSIRPCAYHNPVFVDVDGRGFEANGDTLGYPLAVCGLTADEVRDLLERR